VTCNFGTLQPGAQGTFTVTVGVNSNATGTVNNGNYSFAGTNFPPVLGPLVSSTIGIRINPTQVPTLDRPSDSRSPRGRRRRPHAPQVDRLIRRVPR
jgi:hypothetical protein